MSNLEMETEVTYLKQAVNVYLFCCKVGIFNMGVNEDGAPSGQMRNQLA